MEVKTTKYYKKIKFLDIVQYLIAAFIGIGFLLWLLPAGWNFIPTNYPGIQKLIIGAIIIQAIISILRLRVLGLFLELFLLLLALLSLIPYAGYFFRFLGLIFVLIELGTFQSYQVYKHVDIKHEKTKEEKRDEHEEDEEERKRKKHTSKQIKDADFDEK